MVRIKRLGLLHHGSPEQGSTAPGNSHAAQRKRWIRLPHLGKPSNLLARELRRMGYHAAAFYPVITLSSLSKLKDKTPLENRPGVYRLNCGDCQATYVGQTGRRFKKRFAEHRTAYNTNKPQDSAMARHCLSSHHNFNKVTGKLIHQCSKGKYLDRVEETETLKALKVAGNNLLNDLSVTFTSPFTRYILGDDSPTLLLNPSVT